MKRWLRILVCSPAFLFLIYWSVRDIGGAGPIALVALALLVGLWDEFSEK